MTKDLIPIDGLIAFAGSEHAVQVFGADGAKRMSEHAQTIKAAGDAYCDCPACSAAAAILEKKKEMLA